MKRHIIFLALLAALACSPPDQDWQKLQNHRNQNRAYSGAPPVIPHNTVDPMFDQCLYCHQRGKVLADGRVAHITPHADFVNCRQCHVDRQTTDSFKKNNFAPYRLLTRLPNVNPAGPPYIPHSLQYRENCAVCHNSQTAEPALVPRHGLRTNCVQCHVPQKLSEPFPLAADSKTKPEGS